MKRFSAPWGRALQWVSVLSVVIFIGVIAMTGFAPAPRAASGFLCSFVTAVLLATVLITALFTVRGYTVTPDAILVHRLFWDTRLPCEGLVSATFEPKVMNRSLRICGNGGLFSFSGWFWSKNLGRYKAYVTDLNRTVVLRWEKRTAIVSPGDPEAFVREVKIFGGC